MTWASSEEILSSVSVRAAGKTGDYVFAGTSRGVFRAAIDSSNWGQVNFGLADTNVHSLAVIHNMVFAGTTGYRCP